MATVTISTYDRMSLPTSMSLPVDDALGNTEIQALADAVDAIIRGSDVRAAKSVSTVIDIGTPTPPADEEANRTNKWLLRIQEATTGKIFKYEIGTADNTHLSSPSSDFMDLTAGVGLALKTAVEAAFESDEGRTGTLLSVQQVSRTG